MALGQVSLWVLQLFHRGSPYSYIIWGIKSILVGVRNSETWSHVFDMKNMNNVSDVCRTMDVASGYIWFVWKLGSMYIIPYFNFNNYTKLWDFKFSRRQVWSSELCSGMSHSSLMMEAERTSETSVYNYLTRQYIPEDNSELHTRRRENKLVWLLLKENLDNIHRAKF
jgi:hypothetical protein